MSPRRIGGIVERLNALNPDVIVLLGDYVNALRPRFYSAIVPVGEWVAALAPLHAPLGVYAVLGNHDWWSGESSNIRRAFDRVGIWLLDNTVAKVTRDGEEIWIAGLADQLANNSRGLFDLHATLTHVTGEAPVILLAHEPDIFPHVPERVSLTLAGHTHGGQVYLPLLGRPAINGGRYCRYAHGHIIEDGRHMVVSSGLGVSNFPVRFLVPPEIAMVTLGSPQWKRHDSA